MRFELDLSPSHPTNLPALEQRLEARLLELERLHRARPGLPTAMARAEAGQRIDDLLDEIAELQRRIDVSPAETLEDAAVKLRRLGAYVERGQPARLLAGMGEERWYCTYFGRGRLGWHGRTNQARGRAFCARR